MTELAASGGTTALRVLEEISEVGIVVPAHGSLQREGILWHLQDLSDPVHGDADAPGDFFGEGFSAQALDEVSAGPRDLVDLLRRVDGNADHPGLVGDASGDGLHDPPVGVGGELVAPGVVELLDR